MNRPSSSATIPRAIQPSDDRALWLHCGTCRAKVGELVNGVPSMIVRVRGAVVRGARGEDVKQFRAAIGVRVIVCERCSTEGKDGHWCAESSCLQHQRAS